MAPLRDVLTAVTERARKFADRGLGEQNAKASLIEPVLEALGWDIRDPDEVHREFRPTGKDSPVDYALKLMRKPRLFVEAKGLGETLSDRKWITQVLSYAVVAGVEWCVLTDGDEFRFYNAAATVDAEEKMFLRIRLTQETPASCEAALGLISRAKLAQNQLDLLWQSYFIDRRVKSAIREIFASPNKAIVKFIQERAPKLTPKEIAESIRRLDIKIESPAAIPLAPERSVSKGRSTARASGADGRRNPVLVGVTLADLINAKMLNAPLRLFRNYKGNMLEATLLPDGDVEFQGTRCRTCSTAAELARSTIAGRRMNTNGWSFWQFMDVGGNTKPLDAIRQDFLKGSASSPLKRQAPPLRLASNA